jgi:hypothetical protein
VPWAAGASPNPGWRRCRHPHPPPPTDPLDLDAAGTRDHAGGAGAGAPPGPGPPTPRAPPRGGAPTPAPAGRPRSADVEVRWEPKPGHPPGPAGECSSSPLAAAARYRRAAAAAGIAVRAPSGAAAQPPRPPPPNGSPARVPGGAVGRVGSGAAARPPAGSPGGLSIEAGTTTDDDDDDDGGSGAAGLDPRTMTWGQRLAATLRLWPYTVPLFVVYAAEYAMMSGVWSAMGFPVDSDSARHMFYLWSNWAYQVGGAGWAECGPACGAARRVRSGCAARPLDRHAAPTDRLPRPQAAVFISRSSGTLLPVGRRGLWAMPALQFLLLLFFTADAALHW